MKHSKPDFWSFNNAPGTINSISAQKSRSFFAPYLVSFAQWQYRKQWGLSELRLLLIENYTQYPAVRTWNTVPTRNFWWWLRPPRILKSHLEQMTFRVVPCKNKGRRPRNWPSGTEFPVKSGNKKNYLKILSFISLLKNWFLHFSSLKAIQ